MIKPISRIYYEEAAYRNFVRQEYLRKLQAHKEEVMEPEEKGKESDTQKLYSAVRHHKILVAVFSFVFLAVMVFYARTVLSIIEVSMLLVIASFSTVYKRKMGMPLGGVELVTFGTVLTSVAFGPVVGILFGIVSSLASSIIAQDLGPLTWIYVFACAIVGLLAGYFSNLGIVFLGIASTVFLLLINQVVYLFIGDEDVKSITVFYIITNLVFNFILFSTIGGRVLSLLTF